MSEEVSLESAVTDESYQYVLEQPLSDISESLFIKKYLPNLVSALTNGATVDAVDEWVSEVAGSEFLRVNVWDDDRKAILFFVPPMRYTTKPGTYTDLADVLKHSDRLRDRSTVQGNAFFEENMSNVMALAPTPKEDTDQWRMIFTKYGYIKPSANSVAAETTRVNAASISEEEDF